MTEEKNERNTEKKKTDDNDLKMVRRRLYARDESVEDLRRQEELHRLGMTEQAPRGDKDVGTLAQAQYKNLALLRAKRVGRVLRFSALLALTIIVVAAVTAVVLWYRSTQTVTQSRVALSIEAPQELTAGDEIIYVIPYANESRVDWENVELVVTPPRGFTFRGSNREVEQVGREVVFRQGMLPSGDTAELHVRGQLIGEQNETAVAQAEIFLTPENFPSGRFSKTSLLATTIAALPLDVSLEIPGDAASGERVLATISVRNLSNTVLDNAYLRLLPATGVELAFEDAEFSADFRTAQSEWLLPQMAPLEEAKHVFVFHLEGQPAEKRAIDFVAGLRHDGEDFVQRELTHVLNISASEVLVEQRINGSSDPLTVQAGEVLSGEVQYRNVGTTGLKEVIVTVAFDGGAFDPSTLNLGGQGSYDPLTKTITWSAASVPELSVLQPQEEGTLTYSFGIFPVDELPADTGVGTQNQVLVTTATVDSPDLPTPVGQPRQVISDRAVLSVGTNLLLSVDSFYDDGRLGITSEGPLPPTVGQTTTYTIRFRVGSSLNDVSGVTLTAVLPDGVRYTEQSYTTGGDVRFSDRSGEISWSSPLISGLTGRALPYQELHIQVSITPGEDRQGGPIRLLNRVSLEAVDEFTGNTVEVAATDLPDTESASPGQGNVE